MILNPYYRFWILLLVILAVSSPVWADETNTELSNARHVFLQAVDGDKRAVRDAISRFKSLSHSHPDDPVYLAYLGASITLKGRDAANGINKQRYTEEGLQVIDQALKQLAAANDLPSTSRLDTMLVAVNSFIRIPAFFNRYDRGRRLLDEILAHEDFDAMAARFKAAAYVAAALVARGNGDDEEYRRYLKLVVDTDPDGRDGRFASTMLAEP